MDIVIDFDGTCVAHEYPAIGMEIGAVPVLKRLVENGHKLILFTMRSDGQIKKKKSQEETNGPVEPDHFLSDAIEWFARNEIPLYGIQKNPKQVFWTKSPKAYGHLYIDDAALGCPLVIPKNGERPYVDWSRIEEMLEDMGILPAS